MMAAPGGCFGFILNDLAPEAEFPYDLGGWTIDRARAAEIEAFRPQLQTIRELLNRPAQRGLPYEATMDDYGGGVGRLYNLPPEDWRYSVVRMREGANPDDGKILDRALRITPDDLRIGGWVDRSGDLTERPVDLKLGQIVYWMQRWAANLVLPQTPNFARASEIFELRRSLNEEQFPGISRAISIFTQLDWLPEDSDAKFLGYFSVLESILTHSPEPLDPVDSITRQLKRNLKLLDHRMPPEENLEFSNFGQNAKSDQVIAKLYAVRSAVAHGGDAKAAFQWLHDRRPHSWRITDSYQLYLRKITQRVLVAALAEPQLVVDLRG